MAVKGANKGEEQVINTACSSHCGGACLLKVHVKDGVITRIETDDGEEPQLRACLRCRAYRQRVYDPDRLKYPMKRVGERGEGKFERISWDEALDKLAEELTRVRKQHGPKSLLYLANAGDAMRLHTAALFGQLLNVTGGYTTTWGVASFEGGLFSSIVQYGSLSQLNGLDDLVNSRLIILWGCDPTNTIHETNCSWTLLKAKESGTKIIIIDPRYTNSAAALADQWIPIIPGTDTAMIIAMAYVIIKENLHDSVFIAKYTTGFSEFKHYVLGVNDNTPKTPLWAEKITGVAAGIITDLAREYAKTKPAAFIAGIAPGRTAYGEQYHRAASVLAALTGNIGIHGGWGGMSYSPGSANFGGFDLKIMGGLPQSPNPAEAGAPKRKDSVATRPGTDSAAKLHFSEVADAILKGKSGGYPADIKMLVVWNTNPVNQYPNTNKMVRALKHLEFITVFEQVPSATARFADLLLPVSTFMERNAVLAGLGVHPYYGYVNKIVEPLYESKSHLEICCMLEKKLGVTVFSGKTEEEWIKSILKTTYVPDYETFKKKAVYCVKLPEPWVAFKKQIEDPVQNGFETSSGKIEIYSKQLAEMKNPSLPPVPEYIETWESRNDPLAKKYPLQIISTHFKGRAHSQFETLPWLRELTPQVLTMNAQDAKDRGIRNNDNARVFNDRGEVIVPVVVTERIMPGVVDLPQGAWYTPDKTGVDRRGCANVLSRDTRSPGGAACYNTGLVQVEKVEGRDR